jgi:hypothetical protein
MGLKKILSAWGDVQNISQLLVWLFPAGATVVSVWSAWAASQPWYLIL